MASEGPSDRPIVRRRLDRADLRSAWDQQSERWIAWAREPHHDSYWRFHRDSFLELVPAAGRQTLDVGSGEGRLPRDLLVRGHKVVGVDVSFAMLTAARSAEFRIPVCNADSA